MKIVIDITDSFYDRLVNMDSDTCCSFNESALVESVKNGTPLQEILDMENDSEIKNLSKRVEILEKQIKKDMEEKLKKLQAELDYAKFRCALPTITDMMSHKS